VAAKHALHDDRDLVGLLPQGVLSHFALQRRGQADRDERERHHAQKREAQQQASTPEPREPRRHALSAH